MCCVRRSAGYIFTVQIQSPLKTCSKRTTNEKKNRLQKPNDLNEEGKKQHERLEWKEFTFNFLLIYTFMVQLLMPLPPRHTPELLPIIIIARESDGEREEKKSGMNVERSRRSSIMAVIETSACIGSPAPPNAPRSLWWKRMEIESISFQCETGYYRQYIHSHSHSSDTIFTDYFLGSA